MRILAIDYGLKRSGLAVSDELRIIAGPLGMVLTADLLEYLRTYLSHHAVSEIVVGLPSRLNGEDTHTSEAVRKFVLLLQTHFPAQQICTMDERFTTVLAQRALLASGVNKKKRAQKGILDPISATIILQDYMQTK